MFNVWFLVFHSRGNIMSCKIHPFSRSKKVFNVWFLVFNSRGNIMSCKIHPFSRSLLNLKVQQFELFFQYILLYYLMTNSKSSNFWCLWIFEVVKGWFLSPTCVTKLATSKAPEHWTYLLGVRKCVWGGRHEQHYSTQICEMGPSPFWLGTSSLHACQHVMLDWWTFCIVKVTLLYPISSRLVLEDLPM